ncbi:MAG: hypothetical protein WDA20_12760 [Desulfuromonadales bacterium]|jgi:hypothetical protein
MFELIASFFSSVGEIREVYTLVDFYQYIKGIEYLICVAFFIGFVRFFKYINAPADAPGKNH